MYFPLFVGVLCLYLSARHYFVSTLFLQSSSRGSKGWLLCYNSLTDILSLYIFSMALPYGAVGWSAVCDCGNS